MKNPDDKITEVAQKLFQEGKINVVLEILLPYIEKNKNNAEVFKIIGQCYFSKKDYDNSISSFNKAIMINPDDIETLNALAKTYEMADNNKKAIHNYIKVLRISENNSVALHRLAVIFYNINKFTNAICFYKKLLETSPPKNIQKSVLFDLGGCYYDLEKHDIAIEYYQKSLSIKSECVNAWDINNRLGWCYYVIGEYQKAIKTFEKAISKNREKWNSYSGLGFCYQEIRKYKLAIENFKIFLDNKADHEDVGKEYCGIGECYIGLKNFDVALRYFNKCIELNPQNADCYAGIGELYCDTLKDYKNGYPFLEKAVELTKEKDEDYLFDLAWCQYRIRAYDKAVETFLKLIAINPQYPYALNNLGLNYERLKNLNNAIKYYTESIKLCLEAKTLSINNLTELYEKTGKIKEAIQTWKLHTINGELRPKAKKEIMRLTQQLQFNNGDSTANNVSKTHEKHDEESADDEIGKILGPNDYLVEESDTSIGFGLDKFRKNKYSFNKELLLEDELYGKIQMGEFLNGKIEIFKDEFGRIGRQYYTEVGIIDLLCIDKKMNKLIVIELKRNEASDKVVGQISRYMGYVKKNIAKDNQTVEGIIILSKPDKKLEYAVEAHENIKILKYRADISFE